MKHQLTSVVAFMLFLPGVFFAHAQETLNLTIEDINSSSRPVADKGMDKISARLQEVLAELRKAAPELLQNRSPEEVDRMIQGFLSGIDKGLTVTHTPATEKKAPEPQFYPVLAIENGRVVYVRLDNFSAAAIKAVEIQLKNAAAAPQVMGVVFDLRRSTGYDIDNAICLMSLVCPPEHVPFTAATKPERIAKVIVAALIGPETSGSAEFFAGKLRETRTGLTIGAATAGTPFRRKIIALSEGRYLSIPETPPGYKKTSLPTTAPMIPVVAQPMLEYVRIKDGRSLAEDLCLQRACDLIISLHELKYNPAKMKH